MSGPPPAAAAAALPPGTRPLLSLQLDELERVAAVYGFEPIPNDLPVQVEPEPAESVLRRHLAHLRLGGTVLDPAHAPRPRIHEVHALDGVPLLVEVLDPHAPLQQCILCGGPKGETYTICAGCYTTQARFAEHVLLGILPDLEEAALRGIKPIAHEHFVRAIRRTPRLEPRRRARLAPGVEAVRRAARRTVSEAERAVRLDALRARAEEAGLRPAERHRRRAHLHAAEAADAHARLLEWLRAAADAPGLPPDERAQRLAELREAEAEDPWRTAVLRRGPGAGALEDACLARLAAGEAEEEEREPDDDYPVEWLDQDWRLAPDRVDFLDEIQPPFIPRPNRAAGGPEHLAARERNALLDVHRWARSRVAFQPDLEAYLEWLETALEARGGLPVTRRGAAPQEWDEEECDRWDRWVDHVLGGERAAVPEALDPFDAAECAQWGEARVTSSAGERVPVALPRLDRGLPSGRMRWPRFIREEIEAEFEPWGRWLELPDEEAGAFRVWSDVPTPEPAEAEDLDVARYRTARAEPGASPADRLEAWARRNSFGILEREIRRERRRRRFERMADANAGVHPTHLEHARSQSI